MTGFDSSSEVAHPIAIDNVRTAAASVRGKGRDMKNLWYVSVASASTAAAPRRMHGHELTGSATLTRVAVPALLAGATLALACSGSVASGPAAPVVGAIPARAIETPGARDANLAGARCKGGGPCTCRNREGSPAETPPPDEQHKRFEIRLAGVGGSATLDSPTLGHFAAGPDEACFYIDVLPGTTSDMTFTATEAVREQGMPRCSSIAEYGPKGPWWYDIIDVRCEGPSSKCNRDAADAWSAEAKAPQARAASTPAGRR